MVAHGIVDFVNRLGIGNHAKLPQDEAMGMFAKAKHEVGRGCHGQDEEDEDKIRHYEMYGAEPADDLDKITTT